MTFWRKTRRDRRQTSCWQELCVEKEAVYKVHKKGFGEGRCSVSWSQWWLEGCVCLDSVWSKLRVPSAKSLQSCPTLCDPIEGSPSGCPLPGILQARTLEWVAISFSSAWKWKVKVKSLSPVRLLVTPWTAAYQATPSMGVSRQEYWSGMPLSSPMEKLRDILS